MYQKDMVKILEKIYPTLPQDQQFMVNMIIEDINSDEKTEKAMLIGLAVFIGGVILGGLMILNIFHIIRIG